MKPCFSCGGTGRQQKREYSGSVGIRYADELEDCSTCKGRGRVPQSLRPGLFGLRHLIDCRSCGRTGVPYSDRSAHCPGCGNVLWA